MPLLSKVCVNTPLQTLFCKHSSANTLLHTHFCKHSSAHILLQVHFCTHNSAHTSEHTLLHTHFCKCAPQAHPDDSSLQLILDALLAVSTLNKKEAAVLGEALPDPSVVSGPDHVSLWIKDLTLSMSRPDCFQS